MITSRHDPDRLAVHEAANRSSQFSQKVAKCWEVMTLPRSVRLRTPTSKTYADLVYVEHAGGDSFRESGEIHRR